MQGIFELLLPLSGHTLLNGSAAREFLRFMSPDHLLLGAAIMGVLILFVVFLIYLVVFLKKGIYFYNNRIRTIINDWVSQILIEESVEQISIPADFRSMLKNAKARQIMIDELIQCKKNFSGAVAEHIVWLYEQLDLKKDSLRKMKDRSRWFVKAKGIQELYLMDQHDLLTRIYKETNSKNDFVRAEAQIGVIHLTGFDGLRFLEVISYPLTLWQQIKLLEQLRVFGKKKDLSDQIPKWLQSKNSSVAVFALRLIAEYQQFTVTDHVIECLVHPSDNVRAQAIRTLIALDDERNPMLLAGYFSKEGFDNQKRILDALKKIGTEKQKGLLVKLLDAPDNIIKLKAAAALASTTQDGINIVELRAISEPEPFERILKHIKNVR